jgi:hypothetical protein
MPKDQIPCFPMYCLAVVAAVVEVVVVEIAEALPKHLDPSVDFPTQPEVMASESGQSVEVVPRT